MVNRYSGQIQKRIGDSDAGIVFVSSDCRSKYKGKCKSHGSELSMDYCLMWKYGIEIVGILKPPEYRLKTLQADYESMKIWFTDGFQYLEQLWKQ